MSDRVYNITTSNTRFGPWQTSQFTLAEFYERLKTPIKGVESHAAYMAWPKKMQDNAKDVGMFVAGELTDGVRKNGHCKNRCMITLDIDRLPKGGAQQLIARMQFIPFSWVIYSTRKHTADAPRLRVIIPLATDIKPEMYEPLSRAVAKSLDDRMLCFDRTTFQNIRGMYWPSCSCDGEYIYEVSPHQKLMPPDAVLNKLLPNWADVNAWPKCPDEDSIRVREVEKAQDPTTKEGVVGAFCRNYDIDSAIAEFLPGTYIEAGKDRYTYSLGTTSGGAIVYQNSQFLYSHHATDPACDQLLNAFDLVRIHKFGELDNDADPKTPVSKLKSYSAMMDFAGSIPAVKKEVTEERIRKMDESLHALDQFAEVIPAEKCDIIYSSPNDYNRVKPYNQGILESDKEYLTDKKKKVTTSTVIAAMHALGLNIGRNEITGRLSTSGYPKKFSDGEAENTVPIYISDFLRESADISISPEQVGKYLIAITDLNRFNPVVQWLNDGGDWDGIDRIKDIYEILGIDSCEHSELYQTYVTKWLHQSIALAHSEDSNPIPTAGCLVLQGEQGKGKTRFFRMLAVCSQWFGEALDIDMRNKDTIIKATGCWIGELGELDSTMKREQSALKGFITNTEDRYRKPFAIGESRKARRTSFCGTVNPVDYLRDTTGNRRFWTVHVDSIDLERIAELEKDDYWKLQLWLQVRELWRKDPQGYFLSDDELAQSAEVNMRFTQKRQGHEELEETLDFDLPESDWSWLTATQISKCCSGVRLESKQIGHILADMVKDHPGIQNRRSHGKNLWLVPMPKVLAPLGA